MDGPRSVADPVSEMLQGKNELRALLTALRSWGQSPPFENHEEGLDANEGRGGQDEGFYKHVDDGQGDNAMISLKFLGRSF